LGALAICLGASVFAQQTDTNAVKAGYKVPTNTVLEFQVPLSQAAQIAVVNSKNPIVYVANAAIALPAGFNTNGTFPILVVNGTSDGDGSSVRALRAYAKVALESGWVVIAGDGPYGKPTNDTPPWRYAMMSAVLEHMNKTWPASRKWPIASVGFSGGAKWAAVMGAILSQKGYNLIGVFMGGCNEDLATAAVRLYEPKSGERAVFQPGRFKQTPLYLSSGTEDKIATPEQHEGVRQSMISNGFATVRLEKYEGGHLLSNDELQKALGWFMELYKEKLKARTEAMADKATATTTAEEKGKPKQ
jgi:hypothetical protein